MTERISEQKPLPTIWRTPDELWEKIEPILAEYDPPKSTGRSSAPFLKGGTQKCASGASTVSTDDPTPRVLLDG